MILLIALMLLGLLGSSSGLPHAVANSKDGNKEIPEFYRDNVDFQLYDIKSNSGLYFDELANVQVYHSEWAFVTYVNLSFFTSEAERLEHTVDTIDKLCNVIKEEFMLPVPNSYCDQSIPLLRNALEETREFSAKWFFNQEADPRYQHEFRGSRRKRRGILGSISRRLFFSLSEDDAEFYRNQINVLKTEDMEHISFAKNQTTLFQDTLKILNSTMQTQMIQDSALQRQFNELEHLMNNGTISTTLTVKLNELLHYARFVIDGFWEKQKYFFEAITTKSKSFELIPPKKFIDELERVKRSIEPQDLHLPLPLTRENLSKFYQMTTTEARIIENSLVLRFSIPLVEAKRFTLYKAIGAPYRNNTNEAFNYISPHYEYIALDSLSEQFFTLTIDDLRGCHRIDKKNLVCKQNFPIIKVKDNSGCEINLLQNKTPTTNCVSHTKNLTDEMWIKLHNSNTYLYTLPNTQVAAVVCPYSRTKISLQNTGIISLAQKCRIKTERVEIVAFQTIESKIFPTIRQSAKLNISIPSVIANVKQTKSLTNPKLPNQIGIDSINSISKIHDDVDKLHHQSEINRASILNAFQINSDNSISPILLIVLAVVVILVAVVVIFVCFKYCAVPGCNMIIFMILIALVAPAIIYLI